MPSILCCFAGCARVADPSVGELFDPATAVAPEIKPLVTPTPLRTAFWGDLHIHSRLSYDAYTMGVRARPHDAYVYAKGGTIAHGIGYPISLQRPLDFAAVTDHAEYLGVASELNKQNEKDEVTLAQVLSTEQPWRITWYYLRTLFSKLTSSDKREKAFGSDAYAQVSDAAWQEIIETAQRHNQPGRFTTFLGYEWTSMPDEDNLHRNVIYKNAKVPSVPFSSRDSDNPMDLWAALDAQRKQGMEMIAIPHNANVSNGRMYASEDFSGKPLTAEYARMRMRNEPISEILQVKGASETHPILSSDDEFAGFEIYDMKLSASGDRSQPKGSYARDALRTGLQLEPGIGLNPYAFGVIGSSDGHNASSPVEEDNYHGKLPLIDGSAGLRLGTSLLIPSSQNRGAQWSAMGLAAIWAEENTRESLFEAMRRRETYASSGPRILLRFFAGWNYDRTLLESPDFVRKAYADGVPMGGELQAPNGESSESGEAPRFIVFAQKDAQGANLDRVQIIKGWLDKQGNTQEQIFDIAASDGRAPDPKNHRVKALKYTVDVAKATYSNSVGASRLTALWSDPTFDAAQPAFYYVRVLEIATPKWSTYDAVRLGVSAPQPASIQERAITSAIWYRP